MEIVVLGAVYQRVINLKRREGFQKGVECRIRVKDGDTIKDGRVTIYNKSYFDACEPTGETSTNKSGTFVREMVKPYKLPLDTNNLTITKINDYYILEDELTLLRVGYINFFDENRNSQSQAKRPEHDM